MINTDGIKPSFFVGNISSCVQSLKEQQQKQKFLELISNCSELLRYRGNKMSLPYCNYRVKFQSKVTESLTGAPLTNKQLSLPSVHSYMTEMAKLTERIQRNK